MGGRLVGALLVLAAMAPGTALPAQESLTYELMINGESFLLEGNRMTRLESRESPGVAYEVAVRVAPMQRLRLSSIQLLYPLGTTVESDADVPRRTVRLRHELGYTMHLTDLGGTLPADAVPKAVALLADTVVESCEELQATGIKRADVKPATFGNSAARGAIIRSTDARGAVQVNLVYILSGPTYAASCIVQYAEADAGDVLPLVRRTLESIEPLAPPPAASSPVPENPVSEPKSGPTT